MHAQMSRRECQLALAGALIGNPPARPAAVRKATPGHSPPAPPVGSGDVTRFTYDDAHRVTVTCDPPAWSWRAVTDWGDSRIRFLLP
jgi:hypothetical protein